MRSGDKAVYPGRGVVEVIRADSEFVHLIDGAGKILIPVPKVPQLLRPVASASEVQAVFEVLRDRGEMPSRRAWVPRKRAIDQKLNSGALVEVAEVFRDLSRKRTPLSITERQDRMRALSLLSRELAASQGRTEQDAAREIGKAVEHA